MAFSYISRVPDHGQELLAFKDRLHEAILHAITAFRQAYPAENLYAFALTAGQCGNYLGYQLMTEQRFKGVSQHYYDAGYRHKYESDNTQQLQRICEWMRWQNPEDDWYMDDFDESFELHPTFDDLIYRRKAFGEDAQHLVEFCCDDVLATLHQNSDWLQNSDLHSIILGVHSDEADFFTCCVRCNPFHLASQLWNERFKGEELDYQIKRPDREKLSP